MQWYILELSHSYGLSFDDCLKQFNWMKYHFRWDDWRCMYQLQGLCELASRTGFTVTECVEKLRAPTRISWIP